jgi:hypothetical protein
MNRRWLPRLAFGLLLAPAFAPAQSRPTPRADGSAATVARDARYRITVDCFDNLDKIAFKDALKKAGISPTTDVKSLDLEGKRWDHTFLGPADRRSDKDK